MHRGLFKGASFHVGKYCVLLGDRVDFLLVEVVARAAAGNVYC